MHSAGLRLLQRQVSPFHSHSSDPPKTWRNLARMSSERPRATTSFYGMDVFDNLQTFPLRKERRGAVFQWNGKTSRSERKPHKPEFILPWLERFLKQMEMFVSERKKGWNKKGLHFFRMQPFIKIQLTSEYLYRLRGAEHPAVE